jgi:LuxR family maltose regulon positive regulatory protein
MVYILGMLESVLLTKLQIPRLQSGMIHRPRLVELLNKGAKGRLTLVSAAAGFGKTTLLSDWISSSGSSAAWISLDDEHNDLNRFLFYLITAIQKKNQTIGHGARELLTSPYAAQAESVLTMLLNDIADRVPELTLVLDDYHVIKNNVVNETVAFLTEYMPPQMHLFILSRNIPSLPLARFRAKGQLAELSSDDLRFTEQESIDFFRQSMAIELSAENIGILNHRTEGWVAGLQLAALSIKNRDDVSALIKNFGGSHQYVFDYFIEEVLSCQPAQVTQFLEKTSILDRMCAPLCDAVIVEPSLSGQELLESIERANLFIVSLDNERTWYRYHHLFRDLLQKRLHKNADETAGGPSAIVRLHMNASAWYDSNGFLADAFHHAVAAGEFETAARLAEKAWPAMENNFQYSEFIGQMKMLPEEVVSRHPALCTAYAWSLLFNGKIEVADHWIKQGEHWLTTTKKSINPAEQTAQHAARLEELEYTLSQARIYKELSEGTHSGAGASVERVLQACSGGKAGRYSVFVMYASTVDSWRAGNLHHALQSINCLMEQLEKSGNRKMLSSMIVFKGYILEVSGDLNQAARLYLKALENALESNEYRAALSLISLKAGVVFLEQGDLDRAEHFLQQSERMGQNAQTVNRLYYRCIAQSNLKEFHNDIPGALERLQEAQKHQIRNPIPDIAPISAQVARLWIKQGRLSEVKDWFDNQTPFAGDRIEFMREYEQITFVRYLIALYRLTGAQHCAAEADALLDRLLNAAKEGGRGSRVIEILMLQALSLDAQNRITDALDKLEPAIAAALPQKSIRFFVNEGAPMAALLKQAKARGVENGFINTLLVHFDKYRPEDGNHADSSGVSQQHRSENSLLSERELEVLKLVEQGFSNLRIGEKLFISLSTVKGHNLKIFGKLNAKSRTEALARAKELKLL